MSLYKRYHGMVIFAPLFTLISRYFNWTGSSAAAACSLFWLSYRSPLFVILPFVTKRQPIVWLAVAVLRYMSNNLKWSAKASLRLWIQVLVVHLRQELVSLK